MQWSEKPSKQTALTCPKMLQKYNIRDISSLRFKQGSLDFQGLNIPAIATNSNLIPCVLFVPFSALWCTLSLVHTQGRLKQF